MDCIGFAYVQPYHALSYVSVLPGCTCFHLDRIQMVNRHWNHFPLFSFCFFPIHVLSLLVLVPFFRLTFLYCIANRLFFFVEMKKSVPFLLPLPSNNTTQKKIVKTTAVNGFVFNYKNAYFASSQQIDLISMLSVSYAILVYVNHIKYEWSWIFRDKCRTHKSHLSLLEFCISYFVRNCLVILGGIFSRLSVIYMFLQQTNTLTYTHIA